ncbi:DUF2946 family protein [Bordetella trematum]|uniref:DUF2946 family protein n=1 Tax=Bordetella trematum TaxID=123899 RepID=UPI001559BB99|nr:DUF2946 family protein [Bordetella trematum]
MDQAVLDALQRWPDVPAAYGWLSLDRRGRWHLHPQGAPESITNPQIQAFINRNYAANEAGQWFFQNGPQRVYVMLEGAPYILRLDDQAHGLITHNGLEAGTVLGWWLDDEGQVWARTQQGPGLIDDRDLPAILERLTLDSGRPLLAADNLTLTQTVHGLGGAAPWRHADRAAMPALLGFDPRPQA